MTFGTLDIVTVDKEDYFAIKAEYEIELMIQRIIPSHLSYPLRVKVHAENTRLIRMIMKEYPFKIETNRWNEVQQQIIKEQEIPNLVKKT